MCNGLAQLGVEGAQITGVAGEGTGRGHPEEGKAQRGVPLGSAPKNTRGKALILAI